MPAGEDPDPDPSGDRAALLRELGERRLIERVRRRAPGGGSPVVVGIGDDAAVVRPPDPLLLLTVDTLVEDVHFRRRTASLRDVGAKALAVNLSDIAAMGGDPRFALLALALPPDLPVAEADALLGGLLEEAERHGVALIGGDTCAAPDRVVLTLTLVGGLDGPPLTRAGARPGEAICVTGHLGASAGGLAVLEGRAEAALPPAVATALVRAHRRPTPRLAEGRLARRSGSATAMIDLSDGLATDLGHLVAESGVGAVVWLAALPVADETRQAALALGEDALAWAVSGGEDYELCFTVRAGEAAALAARIRAETGTPVTVIGEVRPAADGVRFVDAAGHPRPVGAGFEHFAPPTSDGRRRAQESA